MESIDNKKPNYRKKLRLTAKGEEANATVSDLAAQAVSDVSADIPQEDIDAFYRTLAIITQNLSRLTGIKHRGEEST